MRLLTAGLALGVALLMPATADASRADRNRDRIPDSWERTHHVSTKGKSAAKKDTDGDGLAAWAEWRSGTSPRKADSDRDGRPDGLEDRDRDGLANGFEVLATTDPRKADSDGDRRRDGREDPDRDRLDNATEARFGFAPRKRDSDGDGIRDRDEHAGVVTTVAGPLVTIALAGGGTLAATLEADSEVECIAPDLPPGGSGGGDDELTGDDPLDADDEPTDDLGFDDEGEDADASVTPGESIETADDGSDPPIDDVDDSEAEPLEDGADELGDDELSVVDPGCGATLKPGALVHSTTVETAPAGLVIVALELLSA